MSKKERIKGYKDKLWWVIDDEPLVFPTCCFYSILRNVKKILLAKRIAAPCPCMDCDNWVDWKKKTILRIYWGLIKYEKIRGLKDIQIGLDPKKGVFFFQPEPSKRKNNEL